LHHFVVTERFCAKEPDSSIIVKVVLAKMDQLVSGANRHFPMRLVFIELVDKAVFAF
jgi:hypothetical protein